MPLPVHGLLKKIVFGVFFAGTTLYSAYVHYDVRSKVAGVEQKQNALSDDVRALKQHAEERVTGLEQRIAAMAVRDPDEGVREMLDATVQVVTVKDGKKVSLSSGVIIYSAQNKEYLFDNYVLCARHALTNSANMLTDSVDDVTVPAVPTNTSAEITIYNNLLPSGVFKGEIVAVHDEQDVAVVYFQSLWELSAAKIIDEERAVVLPSLADVYTIGCSTGLPPVKTDGEVQTKNKSWRDRNFWLVTTNATAGNSGGGVFLKDTNELIGVMAESTTLEVSLMGTGLSFELPVTHLMLMTPLEDIAAWFEKEDLGFLYQKKE